MKIRIKPRLTPQKRWQTRMVSEGRCYRCGDWAVPGGTICVEHSIRSREYMELKRGASNSDSKRGRPTKYIRAAEAVKLPVVELVGRMVGGKGGTIMAVDVVKTHQFKFGLKLGVCFRRIEGPTEHPKLWASVGRFRALLEELL